MRKKILISVFALVIIALCIAIIIIKSVEKKENRMLEITSIVNVKDNYKFEVNIEDEDIVKYIKNYSLNEKENLNDGNTHINFLFEGMKEGRTKITIKCINTIDNSILKEETHNIMVDKKSGISIYVMER